LQALAAVLGGTQSLHTNSRDEALSLPTEESVRIALRTQQIIACESGVVNTVDPLAGSYAIENFTNELEKKAQEYLDRIDQIGGVLKAIESGFIQREIQESAYIYQKKIEAKEQIIVGLNQFQIKETRPENLLKVDPELEKKQCGKIQKLKKERDSVSVKSSLKQIESHAKGNENLVPAVFEAVKSYATLGEISDTLRSVFGEYRENLVF